MKFEKIGTDGRPLGQPTLAAFFDAKNGLMWAAGDLPDGRMDWHDANEACEAYRGAGFTDWRLPTLDELETLRDVSRHDPAADPELKMQPAAYWTSTPLASSPADFAWVVYFGYGYAAYGNRNNGAFVRPVRVARASQ